MSIKNSRVNCETDLRPMRSSALFQHLVSSDLDIHRRFYDPSSRPSRRPLVLRLGFFIFLSLHYSHDFVIYLLCGLVERSSTSIRKMTGDRPSEVFQDLKFSKIILIFDTSFSGFQVSRCELNLRPVRSTQFLSALGCLRT